MSRERWALVAELSYGLSCVGAGGMFATLWLTSGSDPRQMPAMLAGIALFWLGLGMRVYARRKAREAKP